MAVVFVFCIIVGYDERFQVRDIWATVSFSATNAQMFGFNIQNKISWHEDYDRFSYYYKSVILSGYVGLGSCVGGSKI